MPVFVLHSMLTYRIMDVPPLLVTSKLGLVQVETCNHYADGHIRTNLLFFCSKVMWFGAYVVWCIVGVM
jgi:hypothetical protein